MSEQAADVQLHYVPEIVQGEHGDYMAICVEFQLAAGGESIEEAKTRLRAIVVSFCNALHRKGILHKALNESDMRAELVNRGLKEEIVSIADYHAHQGKEG